MSLLRTEKGPQTPALAAGALVAALLAARSAAAQPRLALLFGIGVLLGVTLYHAAFCGGGFWASLHMDRWQALPELGEVVLGERLGWASAALLQVFILGALWLWVRRLDASGSRAPASPKFGWRAIICGPWPLATGAVLLALLNFATLNAAGRPWSVTWGFTLWAAKVARLTGWNPDQTPFWRDGFPREALDAPVLEDVTSLMDPGIAVGALLAASLAGRFAPVARIDARGLASALAGGLLMGYGARIAYGCNIGAFFSGVASTSLHGWLWIAAALPGCWLGGWLRPFFRLAN